MRQYGKSTADHSLPTCFDECMEYGKSTIRWESSYSMQHGCMEAFDNSLVRESEPWFHWIYLLLHLPIAIPTPQWGCCMDALL